MHERSSFLPSPTLSRPDHRPTGSKVEEEHDRPMARRPQVDEAEVAFPKTA